MSLNCIKCKNSFDEGIIKDPVAIKYPACPTCWNEWLSYSVMVINEMRLDMSLPEHRKALRKYERTFFGLEQGETEFAKNPDPR